MSYKSILMFAQIIRHPDYNEEKYENDIALVKLKDPVDLNVYTPACLPEKGYDFSGQV